MNREKTYKELITELKDNLYELFLPFYKLLKYILNKLVKTINKRG